MRIDKWLWNASLFSTRGLAQSAVENGRVKVNGERCNATQEVAPGDRVLVGMGEFDWDLTVVALELPSGFDPDPRDLYEEDEDSIARRAQAIEARKLNAHTRRADVEGNHRGAGQGRPPGQGRPQGRERRPKQKFRRR